ncbi:MAG: molybdenum cofactor biosynthesis protein [Rhodospirillaceae bacterium]|nr:MAG: molybdenum cofactor biosynthesis protein [Rhodospirillaceae bacterium]
MQDRFGRTVTYLRLSVTDRCDLRCIYCMAEEMTFVPRRDLLSLEELDRVCGVFIRLGVRKIRLTGGEPLVRGGIMTLVHALARHVAEGTLEEVTLTTNGTRLARHAGELAAAGVRRVNVSLDSLNPDRFRTMTRHGDLAQVLEGISAAAQAGLAVRINTVALAGINEDELAELVLWSGARGHDICFIEAMPMGDTGQDRTAHYLPLSLVRNRLARRFTLNTSAHRTGGPARYVHCVETGQRIGFITPMTHNFCESCNRVRLSCTGTLFLCLGQEETADLRAPLRRSESDELLTAAITEALWRKPRGHDFVIDRNRPTLARHMSVTGG